MYIFVTSFLSNILAYLLNNDGSVRQNYSKSMPIVDPKNYSGIYEAVSSRLTVKQGKKGNKNENSETPFNAPTNPKDNNPGLGIKSQNVPVKETFDRRIVNINNSLVTLGQSNVSNSSTKIAAERESKDKGSSSIILANDKLRELQELQRELNRSSYEPAKPSSTSFKPRQPTLESIKNAIEKAKIRQMEMASNKNVGTDDNQSEILTADASTSTNRSKVSKRSKSMKKKKKKTKKVSEEGEEENKPKKKKKFVNVKVKAKMKVKKDET